MPTFTAVVCTYNRCESLRQTLDSLLNQASVGDLVFEVVVVDNNSSDATRRTVETIAQTARRPLRYVFEPRQGLSYARNTGIEKASGEVLAFLDDDVIVEPSWLRGLASCFQDTGCDAVAGRVTLLWSCEKPEWIQNGLHAPLISQDLGDRRQRWPDKSRFMLGANMAFRRKVFQQVGLFNEQLGRRGQSLIGGEDSDLFKRLVAAGGVIYYEPLATVQHKVEAQRVSPEFYRKWYTDIAYTQAHQMSWKWHYRLSIMPVWRWLKLMKAGFRYSIARVSRLQGTPRFEEEIWWRFESSFLKERLDHWIGKSECRFSKAQ